MTDPGSAPSGPDARARRAVSLWRAVLAGIGIFMLILAVPVGILTPFPFLPIGLGLGVGGATLLARNSSQGKVWLARQISKHSRLDRMAPDWLKALILGGDSE
ncbi:hypothetical protein D1227_13870 [Henriciella mobilis]|uniref:hypothetical protein n=1 Tax=Henriciella mobilis TaxID=2305467 RepID=UPI000E675A88|nr:hypothetical protein [Henriciella mobilis]RIJ15787.1 hypothetical protein D1231_10845 [Henriciella mobilis]RIJ20175.1 hypothetical protein D1227_13870 [Henriciella mobilis]